MAIINKLKEILRQKLACKLMLRQAQQTEKNSFNRIVLK